MPPSHPAHQLADPLLHLVGGLVGEGDRQDRVGRHLEVADQMGDPVGEHPGLARTGPGDHQHRPVGGGDRLALGGIEIVEERGLGHGAGVYEEAVTGKRCPGAPASDAGTQTRVGARPADQVPQGLGQGAAPDVVLVEVEIGTGLEGPRLVPRRWRGRTARRSGRRCPCSRTLPHQGGAVHRRAARSRGRWRRRRCPPRCSSASEAAAGQGDLEAGRAQGAADHLADPQGVVDHQHLVAGPVALATPWSARRRARRGGPDRPAPRSRPRRAGRPR